MLQIINLPLQFDLAVDPLSSSAVVNCDGTDDVHTLVDATASVSSTDSCLHDMVEVVDFQNSIHYPHSCADAG